MPDDQTKKPTTVTVLPVTAIPRWQASVERIEIPLGDNRRCTNCGMPKRFCVCGRPTKMTDAVVTKLFEAYMVGANHKIAAYHAGISERTLYRWLKENTHFGSRVEELRLRPTLRALNKVFESLNANENSAWRWLESHLPEEFAPISRHKHSGDDAPDSQPITIKKIIIEKPAEEPKKKDDGRDPLQADG